MFGDDDPEDGWDEGDPTPVKLRLLLRLLISVTEEMETNFDRNRVKVRIAFGLDKTRRLNRMGNQAQAPVLTALLVGFALLEASDG